MESLQSVERSKSLTDESSSYVDSEQQVSVLTSA